MSSISQRQDISDPDVIHNFALHVGDQVRLDYLYALTVADINATNPELWNSWRASLMRQLYVETKRALRRGLESPVNKQDWIDQAQAEAINRLLKKGFSQEQITELWGNPGDDYFLRETVEDIVWHAEALFKHTNKEEPLVLIKESTIEAFEGATQIFVYTRNEDSTFATMAHALDQLQLSIQDARIYNSASGYTLDTFFVLDSDGEPIGNNQKRIEKIREHVLSELNTIGKDSDAISRRTPRQLKYFSIPTRTIISNDLNNRTTVLEVITPDRPGLLALLGQIFLDFNISIQNAKITTLGERVEDVFFITDKQGKPLSDPKLCQQLQNTICEKIDQQTNKTESNSIINI